MAQLIDKDALVAEIEKWISGWTERLNNTNPSNPSFFEGGIAVGKHILSFIDTLDVKEVDFSKYYHEFLQREWFGNPHVRTFSEMMAFTAKHFFELGLKAQKGKEV